MIDELKKKAIHGTLWSFIGVIGLQGLQFFVGIILARLLLPSEFGLVGMLGIFIAISRVFIDSGFGAALIQKKDANQIDFNSIFYFNIAVSCMVFLSLFFAAPFIANFYKQPVLTSLLRVFGLVIVINSFSLIQSTLLTKSIEFKKQSMVTIIAALASGIVGISMAYKGFGVWSLAFQQLVNAAVTTTLFWLFSNWRPSFIFSLNAIKRMFSFSSKILFTGILNTTFDNIYLATIGKIFTAADLGYYTRANSLQQLPSQTLTSMVVKVSFPVFSTIQGDLARLKRGMKKTLMLIVFINFPLMIGILVTAKPLIYILLTPKWAPSIIYLQILAIVGLMFPLNMVNLNILQAIGRSDLIFKIEVAKKILIAFNIIVTFRFGILPMIIGQVVTTIIAYYLNAYFNKSILKYSITEQVKDLLPYFFCSVTTGAIVYCIVFLPINNNLLLLTLQVSLFIIIYSGLSSLFRLSAYIEMKEIVLEKIKEKLSPKKDEIKAINNI